MCVRSVSVIDDYMFSLGPPYNWVALFHVAFACNN